MPHEASMIEAVATRHIVSMLLSKRLELGAISVNQTDAGGLNNNASTKRLTESFMTKPPPLGAGYRRTPPHMSTADSL